MSRTIRKKHLLAGLATAGVLGVGIAAPTMAFAADGGTPTPSASADSGQQQKRADRQSEFAEALAKELGVPTDKVTAALEKVREQHKADRQGDRPARPSAEDRQAKLKERLDQAVKDGKLTQEQADAITKAVEAGVFPGGFGGPGHRGGWGGHGAPDGTTGK
ncbi:hypothetical protein ACFOOK_06350 [Micromonospora krabiensis]|uniref:Uncharacterized protein n=1 Tax=Micromonospora krabiensis TaxID=307121 RepID=A0A1C3NCU9_9ACTN|nr:hypothetical protein [Micromonospora krabiensis]SBV30381.1 hypothetical protein GA0070620_5978 [Micromonospora krabiensis]